MADLRLLRVIRPHIVAGGFLGYLVGALFGLSLGGGASWLGLSLGYLIVLTMDLSTHFNNDYFDVEVDRSASFKPFGSVNLLIDDEGLRASALRAAVACSVVSILLTVAVILMGSMWHLVVVVALFNALGWLYSAPPVRLHSRRLGEATIAIGTGFCVPAVGYIMVQGGVDGGFILFSLPLVLYGFILSLSLQIPDYEVDRLMGKRTIVGLIGRRRTYIVALVSAVSASVIYFLLLPRLHPAMASWVSLIPVASCLYGVLSSSDSAEDARRYTRVNISALFLFLACLDLLLIF